MSHFALFASPQRPHALEIVRQTIEWFAARDQTVRLETSLAVAAGCPAYGVPPSEVLDDAALAIAVGGDGTMLGAVRQAAPARVPVLGVNAGALGFLTEASPELLPVLLPRVLAGDYTLEPRMMLHAEIVRQAGDLETVTALNDIVVRLGAMGRIVQLDVSIAGHRLGQFSGDGMILCSPTGSTAYGLSAGGPIVHPTASVLTLVPICPHSLSFRPVVIPATDPVKVLCLGNQHGDEMMVNADGQDPLIVHSGDRIIVRPAAEHALLVKLGLSSFYDRLREKLKWGGGR